LIAHETQEPKLIRAFQNGEDIHSNICRDAIGHVPKDDDERKIWKTVGFARVYGAALAKIVYLTDLPYVEARRLFKATEGIYPAIDGYKDDLLRKLTNEDEIKLFNIFGRFRFMRADDFPGASRGERARNALREAFNWIFQSSGHDTLKIWMMETLDLLNNPLVLPVDDVHDEFVLDVPDQAKDETIKVITETSAHLNDILWQAYRVKMRVPITAAIEEGVYWK
jgi:DNA polymerase-1